MGWGQASSPNKLGGVYRRLVARRAFLARGAAVLGKFGGSSGGLVASIGRREGELQRIQRGVENQGLSRAAAGVVALASSHRAGKAERIQGGGLNRRLMGDLGDSVDRGVHAVQLAAFPAMVEVEGGRPPRGRRVIQMGVALGGPEIHENQVETSPDRRTADCLMGFGGSGRRYRVGGEGRLNLSSGHGVRGAGRAKPSTGCGGIAFREGLGTAAHGLTFGAMERSQARYSRGGHDVNRGD